MSRSSRRIRIVLGSAIAAAGALGAGYALTKRPSFEQRFDRLGWRNLLGPAVKEPAFDAADLAQTIDRARDLMVRFKEEVGSPGIVVAVSIDGKTVWAEGAGLADVENGVPCGADTVMRIASISKSVAMALVGRLWERGLLDMDCNVQEYVPGFPEKTIDGQKAVVTPRLLAGHLAGVRHYTRRGEAPPTKGAEPGDGDLAEFYLAQRCQTVGDALQIFQQDELMHAPGSKYLYTTHGFTLLSAAAESASGKPFPEMLRQLFLELDMRHTHLDYQEHILPGRARGYVRMAGGKLRNAAQVDLSCKWAGGGLASTAPDLLLFAHAMRDGRIVSRRTLAEMWTPHPLAQKPVSVSGRDSGYGLGWMSVPARPEQVPRAGHSGGAVGASSELLVSPTVAVAAIVNLQGVSLHRLVSELTLMFEAHAEHKTDWSWAETD